MRNAELAPNLTTAEPTSTKEVVGYERLRRARVERVVEQGNRTGGWKALPVLARVPRDVIMSIALRHASRAGQDPSRWIYEHHIDWDECVAV
ncbi:hypothetical protein ACFOY2_43275 [Nonomuraea purpurea]|uniref:Integrase n=1 Tax=Nonomuraea purpurea TaxID=1849276 RepID=A0ABV8GMN9_9ACTN